MDREVVGQVSMAAAFPAKPPPVLGGCIMMQCLLKLEAKSRGEVQLRSLYLRKWYIGACIK